MIRPEHVLEQVLGDVSASYDFAVPNYGAGELGVPAVIIKR